jgi:hypothetical protein
MSETTNIPQILIYLLGALPSIYFTYRILLELYHYITKKEEDFL